VTSSGAVFEAAIRVKSM